MQMMRFLKDTQVAGRFFSRGTEMPMIEAGGSFLVPPNPDFHTTLCVIPARNLVRLRLFSVVLINRQVGLRAVQQRWGTDEADIRSVIEKAAPDCVIVALELIDEGAVL